MPNNSKSNHTRSGNASRKRKSKASSGFPILPIALPVAALILGVAVFSSLRTPSDAKDSEVTQTVARLEAMETADVSQISVSENTPASASDDTSTDTSEKTTISAEEAQQQILNGSLLSDVEFRQKFSGTVILGDSITESIWEYGYLDTDVVISKRGLSIAYADDQIATAISMSPSTIFMAFGSNDLESYESDAAGFVEGYKKQVAKLQEALPGVPIYINCVLPITEEAIAMTPALQYYPQYNDALIQMCSDMGLTFLDNSFIVNADPSLYEPDGEHLIASYYPQWLTFMAEMAGL